MKFLLSSLFQLGDLDYYIGILVKHTVSGSIILTQAKYIWDLLQRADMDTAKGISPPLQANLKLTRYGSDYFDDPVTYRSIVGAL